MNCENCRHMTVVGLHDSGPRLSPSPVWSGGQVSTSRGTDLSGLVVRSPLPEGQTCLVWGSGLHFQRDSPVWSGGQVFTSRGTDLSGLGVRSPLPGGQSCLVWGSGLHFQRDSPVWSGGQVFTSRATDLGLIPLSPWIGLQIGSHH